MWLRASIAVTHIPPATHNIAISMHLDNIKILITMLPIVIIRILMQMAITIETTLTIMLIDVADRNDRADE